MGIPEKRRVVLAMLRRWERDVERLEKLFGSYDENDFTDGAEMQRNLDTAAGYARGFLATSRAREADKTPICRNAKSPHET
jgi:hypothetical protein